MSYKRIKFYVLSWLLLLIFTAGYLNVVTLLKASMTTTHFTGNFSALSLSFFGLGNKSIRLLLLVIFMFFIGGVLSGMLFYKKNVGFSKRFGIVTIINAILYFIVNSLFFSEQNLMISTAFIAGVQNAFLTRYIGVVTRTTHITGYLTDCAIYLGRILRGDRHYFGQFVFLLLNMLCFIAGGVIAIIINNQYTSSLVLFPSIFLVLAGVYYLVFINQKDTYEKVLKNI